jgi:hypothetical protein
MMHGVSREGMPEDRRSAGPCRHAASRGNRPSTRRALPAG